MFIAQCLPFCLDESRFNHGFYYDTHLLKHLPKTANVELRRPSRSSQGAIDHGFHSAAERLRTVDRNVMPLRHLARVCEGVPHHETDAA